MNRANIFYFRDFLALLLNILVTGLEYSVDHYSFAVDAVPSMNTDAMPHSSEVRGTCGILYVYLDTLIEPNLQTQFKAFNQ